MSQSLSIKKNKSKEGSVLHQRSSSEKIVFGIVFAVFIFHAFTLCYPVIWMLLSSLKGKDEYLMEGQAFALPKEWLWSNYLDGMRSFTAGKTGEVDFWGMVFNSVWFTLETTTLKVICPCATGYVMSKYEFRGRKVIYSVAIIAMIVPIVGTTASHMRFVSELGIYDTPLYPIITGIGGFETTFLVFYAFFKSVSWSYAEAVQIDGGGPYTIFFKIMLPQAFPILTTYFITFAITYWNAYESVILYLPTYPTLAAGLFTFQTTVGTRNNNYPVYFSGLVLSMIPPLVIFACFSSKIMTSLSIGGLKG